MTAFNRTLVIALSASSLFLTGCSVFSKGPKKPKESKAIASQVEEEFKQRWIEKRAAELMTRGVAPDIARGQAIEEFRLNYSYTTAAGK